ncbi:glycoside hydrolase [Brucella intermedia]|uniref:glycoside hydrolase n=1 Tax=Brucella intermedia TaxID=94625 RepID=UPI00236131AA|nr:glycoside hydrolase [Brucella intermedia]
MRLLRVFALVVSLLFASFPAYAAVILHNDKWSATLEPERLAIAVQPASGTVVDISSGVVLHKVSALKAGSDSAIWCWDDGRYTISVKLKQGDLSLSIAANEPGSLAVLSQPSAALGKGIIFPLAEGVYIPAGNKVWNDFLLERLAEFNTSQDISLPLWGMDHASFSLSWILTNPFNNTARFARNGDGIDLSLEHEFTSLDYKTPMTMLLHLGDPDPLAGAKRYREWLIAEGQFEPLVDKIAAAPQAARLIGATHIYLWGSGLISIDDVKDWTRFLAVLKGDSKLAKDIRRRFESEPLAVLKETTTTLYKHQKLVLVRAFNAAMDTLAREGWQTATPDIDILAERYAELRKEVATTFTAALTPEPGQWGSGTSVATMKKLKAAGLQRLWVGLGEGWEGGLWHPEAIRAGVDAGYLVAPYDSYQTALQKDDHPDWTTAHLGEAAYRDCAIGQKDRSLKAGFQKTGRYTQPDCIRSLMQKRIRALLSAVPFNSWFLDAYAAGMVFDSYPPAKPITQAQYAAGNEENMRWVGEKLKLPIGSEDGNATTARGVLFAHGMQTPVIGWGDREMQREKSSPYFLGRWYPNEKPEIFFKATPLKEPYRTVYFDPKTRLPLYQAVFHGSVITTHHWLFDSMKLTNVRPQNELLQLLYNVPPLYHLSADTLNDRLPAIKQQDSFFRPLHQRLATKGLTDFRWLTPDHLVQQTMFDDGTRMVANFSKLPYQQDDIVLPGQSIAAYLPGQEEPVLYRARM